MFLHIVTYKIKIIISDRATMFWIVAWPFLLATMFYFAFGNLGTEPKLEKINLGVVKSENQTEFIKVLENSDMFNLEMLTIEEAEKSLSKAEITGYVTTDEKIKVYFHSNGLNQSITKLILDSYIQTNSTITNIIIDNPETLTNGFLNEISHTESYSTPREVSDNIDGVVIFFYALIGMATMLGATHAVNDVSLLQANQSQTGARTSVTPLSPSKIFFYSLSTSFVFQTISLMLMFVYINSVLKIALGSHIGYIMLLTTVGSFSSIMIGALLSSVLKVSYNLKIGIVTAYTLIFSFLSGMMSTDIKIIVSQKAKFITYINPVGLVSDGLYSLYYYGVGERFFVCLTILLALGIAAGVGTFLVFRRQQYASI